MKRELIRLVMLGCCISLAIAFFAGLNMNSFFHTTTPWSMRLLSWFFANQELTMFGLVMAYVVADIRLLCKGE